MYGSLFGDLTGEHVYPVAQVTSDTSLGRRSEHDQLLMRPVPFAFFIMLLFLLTGIRTSFFFSLTVWFVRKLVTNEWPFLYPAPLEAVVLLRWPQWLVTGLPAEGPGRPGLFLCCHFSDSGMPVLSEASMNVLVAVLFPARLWENGRPEDTSSPLGWH